VPGYVIKIIEKKEIFLVKIITSQLSEAENYIDKSSRDEEAKKGF
jgi:hypothetical protein